MKRIEKIYKEKIDSFFFWIFNNRYRLFLFIITVTLFLILSTSPYVNLVIEQKPLYFLIFALFLIFFHFSYRKIFLIGLVFLVLALFLVLLTENETAESAANYSFGVFFIGILKFILSKDS